MENIGQTNNPENIFTNMSELEHNTSNNNLERQSSNRTPGSQNSQIPVAVNIFSNQAGHQPLSVIHAVPNAPPLFVHGMTNVNGGQIPVFNQRIVNFNQIRLPPYITPASPNPNPLPGFHVGNTDSYLDNLTVNIPRAFPDRQNTLFNVGTSVPNEANTGNVAPPTRRGRPLGSKNKPTVHVYPNEELSTPLVVLEFPPNCEIISWLLAYAQRRNISLAVLGGFGSIAEVVFKPVGSQPSSRKYSDRIMAMMSISGTYVFSPSYSFFNAKVARNRDVISGGALKIVTAGHAVLKVSLFPHNPFI